MAKKPIKPVEVEITYAVSKEHTIRNITWVMTAYVVNEVQAGRMTLEPEAAQPEDVNQSA